MPLVQLHALTVAFGGPPVLDAVDLAIERGERLALLGRNGAGKSTLLRVIAGLHAPDGGRVVRSPGLEVAVLPQDVPASLRGAVHEVVRDGRDLPAHAVDAAATRVGLESGADVAPLSAGLKRRVLLARALASDPDLLVLDEPTNHLDVDAIAWMEDFLRRQAATLLFVTHDRAFLRGLATGILDLDRGRLVRYGPDYDDYMEKRRHALAVEQRATRQADRHRAGEEAWIRRGVRERRKRNQGRVRRLEALREEHGERRERPGTVQLAAAAAAPSGRLVVRAEHVGHAWDGTPVVEDFSTDILRGERVGLVGPNGTGKTTLLRILVGDLQPQRGHVRLGAGLEIAWFDQLHASLDDRLSAADNVAGGEQTVRVGGRERHVVSWLQDFLFTADEARGGIAHFSGGERNRLLLARLFARPSNFLVLDEPTNDLDMETLEVLEVLIDEYEGTVLLVSHDRELLDGVLTSTILFEGGGRVSRHAGGWSACPSRRGGSQDPKPMEVSAEPPPETARPRPTPRLTAEERRLLEALPAHIEKLERDQARLFAMLSDPAFFERDAERIETAQRRVREFEAAIAQAYRRWEDLEARRG